ncbi:MAG: tryptophan 2,3-dioxygenase [Bdellovibrionaceae bacterium]|nr:hypothetical protein [Bdellovibrionales bacterium]MCB9254771.1 tryptophan 2,3-dioxygenase [Pseudobdellovibrionaceae bacterium]
MGRVTKDKGAGTPSTPRNEPSYSSYLKVSELTSLQEPLSVPAAHDEMLFIIVHQTYELWFKQVLYELEKLVSLLTAAELIPAFRLFDRVCEIFRVLIQQIDILETMTPTEFNRFRSNLQPASGFQSTQFRELELMVGAPQSDYTKFFKLDPEWKNTIKVRLQKPSLRDAFLKLLLQKKLLKKTDPESILQALLKVYDGGENTALHNLCEYLIRFDEQLLLWRFRHVQMVERMIGMKRGTGGSLGVAYLQQTLQKKFFPELWEARTHMGGLSY